MTIAYNQVRSTYSETTWVVGTSSHDSKDFGRVKVSLSGVLNLPSLTPEEADELGDSFKRMARVARTIRDEVVE